jgi:hypothetical protein
MSRLICQGCNGAARAKVLKRLIVTDATGDLLLEFDSGVRRDLFNNSSGEEGWS